MLPVDMYRKSELNLLQYRISIRIQMPYHGEKNRVSDFGSLGNHSYVVVTVLTLHADTFKRESVIVIVYQVRMTRQNIKIYLTYVMGITCIGISRNESHYTAEGKKTD